MIVTIVDSFSGQPVKELPVRFEQQMSDGWKLVSSHQTDDNGSVRPWLVPGETSHFRCVLDAGQYFTSLGLSSFYPDITVALRNVDPHHHRRVTVLISAYAFMVHEAACPGA